MSIHSIYFPYFTEEEMKKYHAQTRQLAALQESLAEVYRERSALLSVAVKRRTASIRKEIELLKAQEAEND